MDNVEKTMRILRNKIRKLIAPLILLSLIWANFTVFYFAHPHIDENGNIIVHVHPYHKEKQAHHHFPNHTHSKNEFALLALIYHILSVFVLYWFAFHFFLRFNPVLKNRFSFQWNPNQIFCKTISNRGPPFLIQFS